MKAPYELSHADLAFTQEDLLKAEPRSGSGPVIGQPRALQALDLGTAIRAPGYNIFVTGQPGTGRQTAVKKILAGQTLDHPLQDLVYVYNFAKPENPVILCLPQGRGAYFKHLVHELVESLKLRVKKELGAESFKEKRDQILRQTEFEENHQLTEFESRLGKEGFKIIQTEGDEESSADILPVYQGQPISFDELQGKIAGGEISEEDWNATRDKYYGFIDEMKLLFDTLRGARQKMDDDLTKLQVNSVRKVVHAQIQKIHKKFPQDDVTSYLDALEADVMGNLYLFTTEKPLEDSTGNPALIRYGVNVLVDRGTAPNVPVVFENRPTFSNLFGTVEGRMDPTGETRTNFMMIRPGSLIQASGGYLVLRAEDLFSQDEAWMALKQCLESRQVEIQLSATGPMGQPMAYMKPAPVPISVKVIIMGPEGMYDVLIQQDPDFGKLFKICAEFDSVMDRTPQATGEYLAFMDNHTVKHKLLTLDHSGRAAILAYGIRLAEHRHKLSTRFSAIADLLFESDYWARKLGLPVISQAAVHKAQEERKYLFSLPEEKMDEQVGEGQILLATRGTAVGVVNGLAVLDRGSYSFGRPIRITATSGPGDDGIVNVEGEAGLSGEIHDKGVLILRGLIRSRFAQNFPLSLSAGVAFEQSYGGVDGDSASSTEVYALLSAISGVPLRQDLAVSGSINQLGQIQSVGGITEKVEGFYYTCAKQGLTGTQGVLIPYANVQNLVPSPEVLKAMEAGQFHIYPVKTLEEGLALLTGMKMGEMDSKGKYPQGTLGHLIVKALGRYRDLTQDSKGS